MAKIVITSDANFVYLVYNSIQSYSVDRKIRRVSIVEVQCLANNQGIELDMDGGDSMLLKAGDVDTIDADADVQTEAKLYAKLKGLM